MGYHNVTGMCALHSALLQHLHKGHAGLVARCLEPSWRRFEEAWPGKTLVTPGEGFFECRLQCPNSCAETWRASMNVEELAGIHPRHTSQAYLHNGSARKVQRIAAEAGSHCSLWSLASAGALAHLCRCFQHSCPMDDTTSEITNSR